jgi:hypothetical protein
MTLPNLDQTEGIWIERTHNQGFHYIQDIFSSDTPRERYHQDNCRLLISRGSLQPETPDGLAPSQRIWLKAVRYRQVL